ncbi:MAG: PDZ domain-containing protein [Ruminococcaceae bacterium]|nr:PDZ domain-containing protein [Oscillospiraceae bacterium]
MKKHSVLLTVALCLLSAALTFALCVGLFAYRFGGKEGLREVLSLRDAMQLIEDRFVEPVEGEKLTDGALRGMVNALEDPWSYYMSAEEYAEYMDYAANQYSGVGITVRAEEDGSGLRIVDVAMDSPADRAGVLAGMLLTAVDDEPMQGKTADQAREAILAGGEDGVKLTLLDENEEVFSCTLVPEVLQKQAVFAEMLEGDIGYIKITNFEADTAENALKALETLRGEGSVGIIFDVRGNPGGKLSELTALLDALLPEGEIFISSDREGNESIIYSDEACIRMPMAVLVDENSYSAAEYFAAAMSEYGWAETFGAQTTGKARGQMTFSLSDGGALHFSTMKYLTPERVDLSAQGGFAPEHVIERNGEDDLQLEAALAFLIEGN